MLLLDKAGAVDFDDLKAVIGILCETAPSFTLSKNSTREYKAKNQPHRTSDRKLSGSSMIVRTVKSTERDYHQLTSTHPTPN
ncbi:hypothetical protein AVEN_131039-1 [Araneus ventricosus]|uniref:Uncharacterized protein n=1 Tax=Araneus ventricosus TaxID=182803 RepID=A0A4Y2H300_ARAVE|nr:hypothetical protein AVEN_131039-1 [Araneus ventricosus]